MSDVTFEVANEVKAPSFARQPFLSAGFFFCFLAGASVGQKRQKAITQDNFQDFFVFTPASLTFCY
jgi:hypothetical protein